MAMDVPDIAGGLQSRPLASARGWSVSEFTCVSGPDDRPFEEQHDSFSIALVAEGTFNYRSGNTRDVLHPGALLLCNHRACYQCGHDHSTGDRCISVRMEPEFFEEAAATAGATARFRFSSGMLPASRQMLPHAVLLEADRATRDPLRFEEQLIALVAATVRQLAGGPAQLQRVSARDERRIGRTLRHMESHAGQRLDLDRLAGVAAMSKFHFLRVFRRAVGLTPHQFLLNLRLRGAAVRLLQSGESVTRIAMESGFDDLSGFNHAFRARFGTSPQDFRRGTARLDRLHD